MRIRSSGRSTRAGTGAEVLGADVVQELAELLDLVLLLVRDLDPDLVEQCLGAVDRGTGADGEGDGVRRAGADRALVTEEQLGDVDAVAHLEIGRASCRERV